MKVIGIILASNPGYSETFLINKITNLRKVGLSVIVFVDRDTNPPMKAIKTVVAYQIPSNAVLRAIKIFCVLLFTVVTRPATSLRFVLMEREDGRAWVSIMKNLYRVCHTFGYDIDWIHFEFATLALGRENLGRAIGARLATSLRGFDISLYPLHHENCYHLLWKRVDKVHAISDDLYQEALQQGYPSNKSWVKITPAIQISLITPRRNLGFINVPVRIISVGRLEWKKGFEYALRAMSILKHAGLAFEYKIIGEGKGRESLHYSIIQQDLEKYVKLVGKLSYEKTMRCMKESDIYLQPSIQEGFCNALIEAQASGLLCIASNAEGLSENVSNGLSGWIVPKLNPDAIALKILEVVKLPQHVRALIAKNARERVEANFQLESQIVRFERFYTD